MYAKHRFNIFPEMQEEDYQRLVNDIKTNGFDAKNPIYLFEGDVLDGWNRQRACTELNITPVYRQYEGTNEEALMFVLRTNKRRNLTSSQWAAIAVEADDVIDIIREETEKEKIKKQSENAVNRFTKINEVSSGKLITPSYQDSQNQKERDLANWKEKEDAKTATKLAGMFNTNSTYVKEATKIKETKPEIFEQIKRGEKTITEVKKEEKKEAIAAKKNEYFERIEEKKSASKSVDIFDTDKRYRVIYADPAWSYNDKCEGGGVQTGGVQMRHYNTMTTKDICNLPIRFITEKDAVLFLWVTSPLLPDGLEVIKSWGFDYKTSFIWDKIAHNMGHYNSVRHEFLLIATKGSCTPDEKQLFDSVVSIEKSSKHSEKPKWFTEMINTLYSWGDRIELFSRGNEFDNWDFWGNEV